MAPSTSLLSETDRLATLVAEADLPPNVALMFARPALGFLEAELRGGGGGGGDDGDAPADALAAATTAASSSIEAAWPEIAAHLRQEEEEDGGSRWLSNISVFWLARDVFVVEENDSFDTVRSSFRLVAAQIGFVNPWILSSNGLRLRVFAREAGAAGGVGRAVQGLMRGVANDPALGDLELQVKDIEDPHPLPLSAEACRSLVASAPPAGPGRRVTCLPGGRAAPGSGSALFPEEAQRALLAHCHPGVELAVPLPIFGRALVEALRAGRGPRRLCLSRVVTGCEWRGRAHVVVNHPDGVPYFEVLQAFSLNCAVQELQVSRFLPPRLDLRPSFSKSDALALVRFLPPGLLALKLPPADAPYTLPEWEVLWTCLGTHPSLRRITTGPDIERRHLALAPPESRRRSLIIARCLRASPTLVEVDLGPQSAYDREAFEREVAPVLDANRRRTLASRLGASLRNPEFVSRPALVASVLYSLLLQQGANVWLPRVERALGSPAAVEPREDSRPASSSRPSGRRRRGATARFEGRTRDRRLRRRLR